MPFIGNGHLFLGASNPCEVVMGLREVYGPIFTLALPHPTVILAHGDALRQMGELGEGKIICSNSNFDMRY